MAVVSKITSLGFSTDVRIIVSGISEETALIVERDKIASYGVENLCNLSHGGRGTKGLKQTPESNAKRSVAMRGKKCALGYKHTKEAREKVSVARKGKPLSDDHKKKLGVSQKKRFENPAERKKISVAKIGFQHSPEAIVKLRAASQRNALDPTYRKKLSDAAKEMWADPEKRLRIVSGHHKE